MRISCVFVCLKKGMLLFFKSSIDEIKLSKEFLYELTNKVEKVVS